MEGMARGLAILATDVGAVKSVVDDKNGWFVEAGDAHALKQLLSDIIALDVHTVRQKRIQSLERIKLFFWDQIAVHTASEISKRL